MVHSQNLFYVVYGLASSIIIIQSPVLLLSGHLLSGHPLLSGQLLKARNYFQLNTINKTPIKWPPLLSDLGHLLVVPMKVFYCPIKRPPKIKYAWFGFVFDKAMTDKNPK